MVLCHNKTLVTSNAALKQTDFFKALLGNLKKTLKGFFFEGFW